jgi:hypothetical protein
MKVVAETALGHRCRDVALQHVHFACEPAAISIKRRCRADGGVDGATFNLRFRDTLAQPEAVT